MAATRMVMTLLLVLTLCFAAHAAAQSPVGPICLEMRLNAQGSQGIAIFALPMGGSQFLLSAVSASFPYSGAASLSGQVASFTLIAAFPAPSLGIAVGALSGVVDLTTGAGQGTCSAIDKTTMAPTCGTLTPVTYALVSCD